MSLNKKIIEAEATPPETAGFNVITYTGNGSTNSITGFGFAPDLIWLKDRDTGYPHYLYDSSRGALKALRPSEVDAESSNLGITSFDSDGFTLDSNAGANQGGSPNIAWAWKVNGGVTSTNTNGTITSTTQVNNASGISIVEYTGTGSSGSVGHGLSSAPELVITKARGTVSPSISEAWPVYASVIDQLGYLDRDYAFGSAASVYTNPEVSATTLNIDNWRGINQSGVSYMAYCFHSVSGYSKFGSYSGNNTGQTITTGFQPDFLMLKKTNVTSEWWIMDSVRGTTNNLEANTSDAENTGISGAPTFVSTGFNFSGSTFNETGTDWIYMAFKIN